MRRAFILLPLLDKFPDPNPFEEIVFSVEVEGAEERIRKIKRTIDLKIAEEELALLEERKVAPDPIDAGIEHIQKVLKGQLKTEQHIDLLEKQFTAEIKSGPYSSTEKKAKLERLRLKILQLKNNL